MAAITPTQDSSVSLSGGIFRRYYGTGAANQGDTLTSVAVATTKNQRLCMVTVKYSAAPTQTGVLVTLDSGLGAAYDTLLSAGSANIQNNPYVPDGDVRLMPGDAIVVSAPAAGGVITASITIVLEEY